MMDTSGQPGISFDGVFLRRAHYEEAEGGAKQGAAGELDLQVRSRARMLDDAETRGEATLEIVIEPEGERPVFQVSIRISGVFSYTSADARNLDLPEFLKQQAPALLLPFAREAVVNLTARTAFGPVFIPPINVRVLLAQDQGA